MSNDNRELVELPKDGIENKMPELSRLGLEIVKKQERDVHLIARLPTGWYKKEDELYDSRNRLRARVMSGQVHWIRAYQITREVVKEYPPDHEFDFRMRTSIVCREVIEFDPVEVNVIYTDRDEALSSSLRSAIDWLDANRSEWRSPFAYWG